MRLFYALFVLVLFVGFGFEETRAQQIFSNLQVASQVIGQADFTSTNANTNVNFTGQVSSIAISSKGVMVAVNTLGNMWVWNRVPLSSSTPADYMLDFNTALGGVSFSNDGNLLFLSQSAYNRVMIYKGIPTRIDASTVAIIGQPNEFGVVNGCSQNSLDNPIGVTCLPNGRVIVADYNNGRFLIFNKIPSSNGVNADVVIGKPDFVNTVHDVSSTVFAVGTSHAAVSNDGKLVLVDNGNRRILVYNTIPSTNGAAADVVIGQPSFTVRNSGLSAVKYNGPAQVLITKDGKLVMSDFFNNRVLIYNSLPSVSGAAADIVLGQSVFNSNLASVTSSSLTRPQGLAMDAYGRLYVAARSQNRVMVFGELPTAQSDVSVKLKGTNGASGCNGGLANEVVIVKNNGSNTASVVVSAGMPYGLSYTATASAGSFSNVNNQWTISALNAGDSALLTLSANVPSNLWGTGLRINAGIQFTNQIDVNGFNNGVYALRVYDNNAMIDAPVISLTQVDDCVANGRLRVIQPVTGGTYIWNNGHVGTDVISTRAGIYRVQLVLGSCTSAMSNALEVVGMDSVYFQSSALRIEGFKRVGSYGGRTYFLSNDPIAAKESTTKLVKPVVFRDGGELVYLQSLPEINNSLPIVTGYQSAANSYVFSAPSYETGETIQPWLPYPNATDTANRYAVGVFRSDVGYYGLTPVRGDYNEAYLLGYVNTVNTSTSLCNDTSVNLEFIGQPASTYRLTSEAGFYNSDSVLTDVQGYGKVISRIRAGSDTLYLSGRNGTCRTIASSPLYFTNLAAPVIEPVGRLTTCLGGNVRLRVVNPINGVQYYWSNGATGTALTVSVLDAYSCAGYQNGCGSAMSNVLIASLAPLTDSVSIAINGDTILQADEYTTITARTALPNVRWSTGETTRSITINAARSYSVVGIDENGCTTSPISVNFVDAPLSSSIAYTFAQRNSRYVTYTANTNSISSNVDIDDEVFSNVELPFVFRYFGISYSSIAINTNGLVYLGDNNPVVTDSPFSNSASSGIPFLAPFGFNLRAYSSGNITTSIQGSAPNRAFVIQWRNFKQSGLPNSTVNFQVWMYEASGIVEYKYGSFSVGNLAALPQVGINDFRAGTQFSLIQSYLGGASDSTVWQESSSTSVNNVIMPLNASTVPTSGLTYRFVPAGVPFRELNSFLLRPNSVTGSDTIVIQGSGLTGLNEVEIGSYSAARILNRNDSRITAIIENKNSFGYVSVFNNSVLARSSQSICITRQPIIANYDGGTLCDSSTNFILSVLNPDSQVGYSWFRNGVFAGSGTSINSNVAGAYTVKVVLANGVCTSAASLPTTISSNQVAEIDILSAGSTFTDFNRLSICRGFRLRFAFQGEAGVTYQLLDEEGNQIGNDVIASGNVAADTFNVLVPNTANLIYIRAIKNGCFTVMRHVIKVQGAQVPIIASFGGTSACAGYGVTLSVTNVEDASTYIWNNGVYGDQITVYASGDYSVQAVNSVCASAFSGIVPVTINDTPHDPIFLPSGVSNYLQMNGNGNFAIGGGADADLINILGFSDRFGVPNGALRFTGGNSFVTLPTKKYIDSSFTMSFWTQLFTYSDSASFLEFGNAGSDRFRLFQSRGKLAQQTNSGGVIGAKIESADSLELNKWILISVSKTNNELTIYKNGVKWFRNLNTLPINPISTSINLLGKSNDFVPNFLNGAIDELLIINRRLDSAEIAFMYNQQKFGKSIEEVTTCEGGPITLSLFADSTVQYRMIDLANNALTAFTDAPHGYLNLTSTSIRRVNDSIKIEGLSLEGCSRIFNYRLGYNASPVSRTFMNVTTCYSTYNFGGEDITSSGTYTHNLVNSIGCDSLITLSISFQGFITNFISRPICINSGTTVGTHYYTQPGIYRDTLSSAFGCDSIVISEVSFLPVIDTTVDRYFCNNSSFIFNNEVLNTPGNYVSVFRSSRGCDSTVHLNLIVRSTDEVTVDTNVCSSRNIIIDGVVIDKTSSVRVVLVNQYGCDSVVNLNITIVPLPIVITNVSTCNHLGYKWRSKTFNSSGIYYDTVSTIGLACDSIYGLNINFIPNFLFNDNVSICTNTGYLFRGRLLTSSGVYFDSLISTSGCDSIYSLTLQLRPTSRDSLNATICSGTSFSFTGRDYFNSGIYVNRLSNTLGCDSITILNLVVSPYLLTELNRSICEGGIYIFKGIELMSSGLYYDTLRAASGCDSIVKLSLVMLPKSFRNDTIFLCAGSSYNYYGRIVSEFGTYLDTAINSVGCDSLTTLVVLERRINPTFLNVNICNNRDYDFNGRLIREAGVYRDTIVTAAGCDSIVILTLRTNSVYSEINNVSICAGSSYSFNSRVLTSSGTYSDSLLNINGCDSVITINLTVRAFSNSMQSASICESSSYRFGNRFLSLPGLYYDTLMNVYGCDSISALTLTVNSNRFSEITREICSGGTYVFGNRSYSLAGRYLDTLRSISGCDSIVALNLNVNATTRVVLMDSICNGSTYSLGTRLLRVAGVYEDTLQTIYGCDSVVQLTLRVLQGANRIIEETVCAGGSRDYGSGIVFAPSAATFYVPNSSGCLDTLGYNLRAYPVTSLGLVSYDRDTLKCSLLASSYSWRIDTMEIARTSVPYFIPTRDGVYGVILQDSNGCVSPTLGNTVLVTNDKARIDKQTYRAYPNPFTQEINLHLPENVNDTKVLLLDYLGRSVLEFIIPKGTVEAKLPTQNLPAGAYSLRLSSENGSQVIPLIKAQ